MVTRVSKPAGKNMFVFIDYASTEEESVALMGFKSIIFKGNQLNAERARASSYAHTLSQPFTSVPMAAHSYSYTPDTFGSGKFESFHPGRYPPSQHYDGHAFASASAPFTVGKKDLFPPLNPQRTTDLSTSTTIASTSLDSLTFPPVPSTSVEFSSSEINPVAIGPSSRSPKVTIMKRPKPPIEQQNLSEEPPIHYQRGPQHRSPSIDDGIPRSVSQQQNSSVSSITLLSSQDHISAIAPPSQAISTSGDRPAPSNVQSTPNNPQTSRHPQTQSLPVVPVQHVQPPIIESSHESSVPDPSHEYSHRSSDSRSGGIPSPNPSIGKDSLSDHEFSQDSSNGSKLIKEGVPGMSSSNSRHQIPFSTFPGSDKQPFGGSLDRIIDGSRHYQSSRQKPDDPWFRGGVSGVRAPGTAVSVDFVNRSLDRIIDGSRHYQSSRQKPDDPWFRGGVSGVRAPGTAVSVDFVNRVPIHIPIPKPQKPASGPCISEQSKSQRSHSHSFDSNSCDETAGGGHSGCPFLTPTDLFAAIQKSTTLGVETLTKRIFKDVLPLYDEKQRLSKELAVSTTTNESLKERLEEIERENEHLREEVARLKERLDEVDQCH
ncbi:hypothetical protein ADUPG1_006430 [Aduncisulcus paluster]|uniref:Uncharacterized protein n=1 Tax=Aduncisulcus paluster TaxID=2918883 RepID=A0ABQ5KI97_9EUKA|nr:hypothetical protein ADUPG1_006430 [Aduncisulcus paluster]